LVFDFQKFIYQIVALEERNKSFNLVEFVSLDTKKLWVKNCFPVVFSDPTNATLVLKRKIIAQPNPAGPHKPQ